MHSVFNNSALPLFVAAILADDPHHTIAPYDLAVAADTLDGSTHFHVVTPLDSTALAQYTCSAVTFQIRLFHQAAVLMRHQMGLDLCHEIHGHHDNNQQ